MSMALYPRQNSTFCLQHCCFELMLVFTIQYSMSIIQHCAFTNQHPYFKFSVLRLHATFVCVCAICLHRNPTFLFSVFTHQHPYFKFTFRSFKCDIHAFHCYVDVRCVCCGAECDMLAAQCNILVGHWTSRLSELTFRWYAAVQNMWAQEWSGFACQDGGVQNSVRHHPADDWKSRQSSYYLVRNWWNI